MAFLPLLIPLIASLPTLPTSTLSPLPTSPVTSAEPRPAYEVFKLTSGHLQVVFIFFNLAANCFHPKDVKEQKIEHSCCFYFQKAGQNLVFSTGCFFWQQNRPDMNSFFILSNTNVLNFVYFWLFLAKKSSTVISAVFSFPYLGPYIPPWDFRFCPEYKLQTLGHIFNFFLPLLGPTGWPKIVHRA